MSHRKGCCCTRHCYDCGTTGCCYSSNSKVTVTYDIQDLLSAYIAEHGADDGTAWWAAHSTGSFELPFWSAGSSPTDYFAWARYLPVDPEAYGIVYRRCAGDAGPGWTAGALYDWGPAGLNRSSWGNDANFPVFAGGCCGTDGSIPFNAVFSTVYDYGVGNVTAGTAYITVTVSNNRCEHIDRGDVTVIGSLDPDVAGEYDVAGTHNGEDYYEKRGGGWYIYLMGFIGIWWLSEALDTMGTRGWSAPDPTMLGTMTPYGTATGTATLVVMPPCSSTVEDQC